eukprot:107915_1
MTSVSQVRELHMRCVPLHRFTTEDVCDHINQWVRNDINHKTHLSKTKQIFDDLKLSGQQMIDMKLTDRIKRIVRGDLLPFITAGTLNRMFKCYDQWKGDMQPPYDAITSKNAQEMADILFHFPLNNLLHRIKNKNEAIDGGQLIEWLMRNSDSTLEDHIIATETGWKADEVRQILSVLFRHHTCTTFEFTGNMDRVWAGHDYNRSLSPQIINKIKDTILEHDVEEIHYKIKNAQPIDEFSDCMINMVDQFIEKQEDHAQTNNENGALIDDMEHESKESDENDWIQRIYKGIAECFVFDQEFESEKSNDLILQFQHSEHWVCNNCGNCNINMMIDQAHTKQITICILCGLSQKQQIILKLKHHNMYMMVNTMNASHQHDVNDHKEIDPLDDIDQMINDEILSKDHAFNLQCPNQNNNYNCVSIMRLTKILIKYKRWLYTIYKKSKGMDDIE